jgi:hypothetical protein
MGSDVGEARAREESTTNSDPFQRLDDGTESNSLSDDEPPKQSKLGAMQYSLVHNQARW